MISIYVGIGVDFIGQLMHQCKRKRWHH